MKKRWFVVTVALVLMYGLFLASAGREASYRYARREYDKAVSAQPGSFKYQLARNTRSSLNKALNIKPGNPVALGRRAALRYITGDYSGAAHDCVLLMHENPASADVRACFAWCCAKLGMYSEAMRNINEATRLRSGEATYAIDKILIEAEAGQGGQSAQDILTVLWRPSLEHVQVHEPDILGSDAPSDTLLMWIRPQLIDALFNSADYPQVLAELQSRPWIDDQGVEMDPLIVKVCIVDCLRHMGRQTAAIEQLDSLEWRLEMLFEGSSAGMDQGRVEYRIVPPGRVDLLSDELPFNAVSEGAPVIMNYDPSLALSLVHYERATMFLEAGRMTQAYSEWIQTRTVSQDAQRTGPGWLELIRSSADPSLASWNSLYAGWQPAPVVATPVSAPSTSPY